MEAKADFQAF